MKYELTYALAIKESVDIYGKFPRNCIQTRYVQLERGPSCFINDDNRKEFMRENLQTPLHLACASSNDEAIRSLIES